MRVFLAAVAFLALPLAASGQTERSPSRQPLQQPAPQAADAATAKVILEVSKSAQSDLQSMMESMKASAARKQQLRGAHGPAARSPNGPSSAIAAAANPCVGGDAASWRICIQRVQTKLAGAKIEKGTKADLDLQVAARKQDLDSTSELGEMESLKLQAAMDRLAKMEATLSNVMKKASDTSASITQNMK